MAKEPNVHDGLKCRKWSRLIQLNDVTKAMHFICRIKLNPFKSGKEDKWNLVSMILNIIVSLKLYFAY